MVDAAWKQADRDESGNLTFVEFQGIHEEGKKMMEKYANMMAEINKFYDENSTEEGMNYKDFASAYRSAERGVHWAMIEEAFRAGDADKDKNMSREEFA